MPGFSDITAICVDTRNHELALSACARMAGHGFARVILVTDSEIDPYLQATDVPAGLVVERIEPLPGRKGYSAYVLSHLSDHVPSGHALLFQWDGFVLERQLWRPEFLDHDYIGAILTPDIGIRPERRVGNGGFCLRSAKLLKAVAQIAPLDTGIAEDMIISDLLADRLEQEHGIRFAPPELAKHFSVDMMSLPTYRQAEPHLVAERTFGFHGFCNFHLVFDDDALLDLVDTQLHGFRAELLASRPTAALIVNLVACGRSHAATELAARSAVTMGMDLASICVGDVVARCEKNHVA